MSEAAACTYLEEAKRLLTAEDKFKLRSKFEKYVNKECAPLVSTGVVLDESKLCKILTYFGLGSFHPFR